MTAASEEMVRMQSEQDRSASSVPVTEPNPALGQLDFLVGEWRLEGRDDTSGGRISGRLRFEWMDGGFYLVQHVDIDYAGRPVRGVEYIGHQASSGSLRSYFFNNEGPGPFGAVAIEYVYEPAHDALTIWGGDVGSPAHFRGRVSEDRSTITGRWQWPGGGYAATMRRSRSGA
jgi:hypothetical protein